MDARLPRNFASADLQSESQSKFSAGIGDSFDGAKLVASFGICDPAAVASCEYSSAIFRKSFFGSSPRSLARKSISSPAPQPAKHFQPQPPFSFLKIENDGEWSSCSGQHSFF